MENTFCICWVNTVVQTNELYLTNIKRQLDPVHFASINNIVVQVVKHQLYSN